ncbi:MAG: hypothetical protein K9L22_03895 [Methylococcaceae bacterium]|nr:hypothetical protein [Methylococcaceae bacterium]
MFRITSQLCEVFDCTDQQLEESGLLDQFNAWLKNNTDQVVSHGIEFGEEINREIAVRFYAEQKTLNRHPPLTMKPQ